MTAHRGWWRAAQGRVLTILVVVAVGLIVVMLLRYSAAVPVSISVAPHTALLDEPVTLSVRGLPAGTRTTITAMATDVDGTPWVASAQFQASADGAVSLGQPSLGGSYTGVNPMGLFQFMAPPTDSATTLFVSPEAGYDVILRATVGRRVEATATVRRQGAAAVGVTERTFRPASRGIYGRLFLPKDTSVQHPAVLVFGGADGGLGRTITASLLAAHGYPSLAVAYFDAPGLPRDLAEIPLEYFARALRVLRAQPGVDPRHVLVMGDSRGGEAALLLGVHFPHLVNGVIAGVPSSVVNPGLLPDRSRPAWTLHGRPLPAAHPVDFGNPNPADTPQAVIPVEKIRGPLLLSCGELDVVWPSCAYSDAITRRLNAQHFAYPVKALRYPEAGHLAGSLTAYYSLTDDALVRFGGSVAGTQFALSDGHARLLDFLASQ